MRCPSEFYVIPQSPLAMPLCCYGDACVPTVGTSAICIFLGRRENTALVGQGF